MKNCSLEAKLIVSLLEELSSSSKINSGDDIKKICFKLINYVTVDIFAEEFISYEGIKRLVDIILITNGNTRSYAMYAFKSLLVYMNSIQYMKENPEVIFKMYYILINYDNIKTAEHALGIFILICDFMKEEGAKIICEAIDDFAKKNNSKIFKELALIINDESIDVKVNAMTLICFILKYSNEKVKVIKYFLLKFVAG